MKQNCKKAGVKYFGVHAIRHLTASILAQANIPMIQIQTILRHMSLATTERYIKRLGDLKPALRVLSREKSRLAEPSDPTRREGETEAIV
jgi:integrase